MKSLVVLLTVVASSIAEPPLFFRNDLPRFYDYRYALRQPFAHALPIVRHDAFSSPFFAGIKSQYYNRDLIGQASYGHIEPGQSHHAVQDALGNKVGGFSFYNADGKLVQTSYIADAAGYRVSTNDLPIDTPEVQLAKAAHLAEHEKAKTRTRRDILTPANVTPFAHLDYRFATPTAHAFPTTNTIPVVKPDGFLADTPEVAAAKALHFSELEAAKARNFSPLIPGSRFDYRFATPF